MNAIDVNVKSGPASCRDLTTWLDDLSTANHDAASAAAKAASSSDLLNDDLDPISLAREIEPRMPSTAQRAGLNESGHALLALDHDRQGSARQFLNRSARALAPRAWPWITLTSGPHHERGHEDAT